MAITGLLAYPNGFDLWLIATLRSKRRPISATMLFGDFAEGQEIRPEFLRFGIQFADGSRCTNLSPPPRGPDLRGPIIQMMMTAGGRHFGDWRLWVWPLPPPGPITFVCQWPAFGVPESRTEMDAGLILDAAARSIQLWPEPDA